MNRDIGRYDVCPDLEEPNGSVFDGLIGVTLPSDIWISPATARRFAADLLAAADQQDAHNARHGLPKQESK